MIAVPPQSVAASLSRSFDAVVSLWTVTLVRTFEVLIVGAVLSAHDRNDRSVPAGCGNCSPNTRRCEDVAGIRDQLPCRLKYFFVDVVECHISVLVKRKCILNGHGMRVYYNVH